MATKFPSAYLPGFIDAELLEQDCCSTHILDAATQRRSDAATQWPSGCYMSPLTRFDPSTRRDRSFALTSERGVRLAVWLIGLVIFVAEGVVGAHPQDQGAKGGNAASDAAGLAPRKLVSVSGLVGSEKASFFSDARVLKVLATQGIEPTFAFAGSFEIFRSVDARRLDLGFPSSAPIAEMIQREARASRVYSPFYSPIVIASWRPVAETLVANGIGQRDSDSTYTVDLAALIALVERGVLWRDLKGGEGYPSERAFAALGMSQIPLLVAYESQLVEHQLKSGAQTDRELVTLYPSPTVFARHVVVPYTQAGERFGALLETSPAIVAIAPEYGYQTGGNQKGPETWARSGVSAPEMFVNVINPPGIDLLDRMIGLIEARGGRGLESRYEADFSRPFWTRWSPKVTRIGLVNFGRARHFETMPS